MCNMESYADAIVGSVGQGLNIEQRKVCVIGYSKTGLLMLSQRLTIGVELAAKVWPTLLLIVYSDYSLSVAL